MNQRQNLTEHDFFKIMQANLASWCELHSAGVIRFSPNATHAAIDDVRISSFEQEIANGHKTELLVFIEPQPAVTVFKQQLDATRKIELRLTTSPKFKREEANQEDERDEPSCSCSRVYMQEADFQRRKALSLYGFHKSKAWQVLSYNGIQPSPVEPSLIEKDTKDNNFPLSVSVASLAFPASQTDESGRAFEIAIQTNSPFNLENRLDGPVGARLAQNLDRIGNQADQHESVKHFVLRIKDKPAGSLSLNLSQAVLAAQSDRQAMDCPAASSDSDFTIADCSAGIFNLFVEPEHRGRGLGSALIEASIDYCRGNRISNVGLFCATELSGFYERQGFMKVGMLEEWKSRN